MFSKLFRQKKPYKEVQAPADTLHFLGEPTGDALEVLKVELSNILDAEGNTVEAYLRLVQYPGENRVRVAVIIDGEESAEIMAPVIAEACQSLVAIDIMFFDSLRPSHIEELQQGAPPFYVATGPATT